MEVEGQLLELPGGSQWLEGFDVVFEPGPGFKAVFAGEDELGAGERGFRVGRVSLEALDGRGVCIAILPQEFLGLFLELFQRRARWKARS